MENKQLHCWTKTTQNIILTLTFCQNMTVAPQKCILKLIFLQNYIHTYMNVHLNKIEMPYGSRFYLKHIKKEVGEIKTLYIHFKDYFYFF